MNKAENYNGWTNYATWRVNLEIFETAEVAHWEDGNHAKEFAEEYIFWDTKPESGPLGLERDYAMAFLDQVNWQEIADFQNEI